MKILFLGKAEGEASVRYRVNPVMEQCRQVSARVDFVGSDLNLWQKWLLLLKLRQYDVLFIQRKLFSTLFTKLLSKNVARIIFDFDDAIFVKSSGKASERRYARFSEIVRSANLVLAGNDFLVNEATKIAPSDANIHKLPTSVATKDYSEIEVEKSGTITLVWIGSTSTRRYLDMLTPVLDRLASEHDNLCLKVISDFDFHLDALPVQNVRWTEAGELLELKNSHIGIAPMLDNSWTRGKCALKVLQYMAAGLPVVSSNYGANAEVVDHEQTGFLVESEEEWCQAISTLVGSEELRLRFGLAGSEKATKYYDLEKNARRAAQLIMECL